MIVGVWRDEFPRLTLTLPGISEPLDVEFIIDTGFGGDLALPESLLFQLNASFAGRQIVELAGGFRQRSQAYEVLLDWDGEPRLVEVLTLDGNPLIGNNLWRNAMLQAENLDGGVVLFEPM